MRRLLPRAGLAHPVDSNRVGRVAVRWAFVSLLAVLGAGCRATFQETHYFRSVDPDTGSVSNYYRLKIDGKAAWSSARYVSGYYDDAAVDLFFNELRVHQPSSSSGGVAPKGEDGAGSATKPPPKEKLEPMDPTKRGSLVMILSTDATAVSNAIGQFAESNVVAGAITNLLSRDKIAAVRSAKARQSVASERAGAVAAELEALFGQLPASGGADEAELRDGYLRILNSIAAALGRQSRFKDVTTAETWLMERRNLGGGKR